MSIKSKTDWIRGYLESLEYSDNISPKQFKILKNKINELLEEVDNIDADNDFEEYDDWPTIEIPSTNEKSKPIFDNEDDLPF